MATLPLLMPRRTERTGRYDMETITREIRRAMTARSGVPGEEVQQKALASAIGISEGQFSHKLRLTKRSRFNIHELGIIADYFKAPVGWPFLSWEVAEQAFGAPRR